MDAPMNMKFIVIYVNSRICQLWKELNAILGYRHKTKNVYLDIVLFS